VSDIANYKISKTRTFRKVVIFSINACLHNIVIIINREVTRTLLRIFIIPLQYSQKIQYSWIVFSYCTEYM